MTEQKDKCPDCGGSGRGKPTLQELDGAEVSCPECKGKGEIQGEFNDGILSDTMKEIVDGWMMKCPACKGTGEKKLDRPNREKDLQNFTSMLSLKLGIYMGKGLFENYPDNFNQMIPQLAKELFDQIIALFPDIERAKREERERIKNFFLKDANIFDWSLSPEAMDWLHKFSWKEMEKILRQALGEK